MVECWIASWNNGGLDFCGAAKRIVEAGRYLAVRARARDPREPWAPVLGSDGNDRSGQREAFIA